MYLYKYLNSKPNPIKVNLEQSLFLNLHDIADTIIMYPTRSRIMFITKKCF